MIELKHVCKRYSSEKMTVSDVSFKVEPGVIYGLLGPNGAGKTTLMQMISTLLKPTSGKVFVCGTDTSEESHRNRDDQRARAGNNQECAGSLYPFGPVARDE